MKKENKKAAEAKWLHKDRKIGNLTCTQS